MSRVKEVWLAHDAAREIGISYQALMRLVRGGKAVAKRRGLGPTNPYQMHVSEVKRLKEIYAPPTATYSQAGA